MTKAIATLGWILGMLLAGSEGPVWVNFIGLAVFSFATREVVKAVHHDM